MNLNSWEMVARFPCAIKFGFKNLIRVRLSAARAIEPAMVDIIPR
jgi:hypothetical protein